MGAIVNDQYKHIVIEGNIGAGKTTAAKSLSSRINGRLILEEFEENPFLPKFYKDKERYAFQVELHFLAERYHQLSRNLLGDIFQEHTVYDYFFVKSSIFSRINLNEDEQVLFDSLYNIMERFIPKPDILVYIHRSVDQLLEQIKNRGRTYESNIASSYLNKITTLYLAYMKQIEGFPVVLINTVGANNSDELTINSKIDEVLEMEWSNGFNQTSL